MGVKVYHNGNWVEFSTGSNASASFLVQDEGNDLVGLATALNFTGNAVVASNTTGDESTKKIHITGITSFLELSDTPGTYVGTAGSVVTVNSTADGLEFLAADSTGVGRDNYVSSASFTSLPVGGGVSLTLGYTGPDTLSDITADLSFSTLGIGFTDLKDTPADFNGAADRFVKVNSASGGGSDGTALEFVSLVPSTAIGAAGQSKQLQFNDSSYLGGAGGLEFTKEDLAASTPPTLILKPNNTNETYGGGRISVQTNDISSTISTPWNRVSMTSDGGLELFRSRTSSPSGGPYIDFKSQLDGNNHPVDMDARIQMDYDRDANAPNDIEPNGDDYSAITFETGGNGHYKTGNLGGRVTEKLRIGKFGEIGLNAGITRYDPTANPPIVDNQGSNRLPEADIYGNPGEVLMSDGKGKSVFWGTNGTGGNLWSQNANGIYRLTDVMIKRSDNANNASLAVHGVDNFSRDVGSRQTVLDLRNVNHNADCLTFYNIRLTQDTTTPDPTWYSAAWRIQRRVDVTDQGYIQFGTGDNAPSGTFDSDIIFGNEDGEKLRITGIGSLGIGTDKPVTKLDVDGGLTVKALNIDTDGAGDGDLLTSGGPDGVFGIYNTTNSGKVVFPIKDSGGNYNNILELSNDKAIIDGNVGIGTSIPNDPVSSSNTNKLAVGIVTCHELYVNGNSITSGGSGGGGSDPVGTIVVWAGSVASIPSEYQLCDGSAASTSALQAITGANVPDLRDKFIVGANNVAAESAYPGVGINSTGGSANAVLIGHSHSYTFLLDDVAYGGSSGAYSKTTTNASTGATGVDNAGNTSNSQTGTNANLPPYYALCYIIKHTATSGSGSGGNSFVLLQEETITSNTQQVEFTGIPSDAQEITVMFKGVSASTNQTHFLVQLGNFSSYITVNYDSTSEAATGSDQEPSTSGFIIMNGDRNFSFHGSMIISKASSQIYTQIGQFKRSNVAACETMGSLTKVTSNIVVDRLRVTLSRTDSTDFIDAGTISVSYKTGGSGGSGAITGTGAIVNPATNSVTTSTPTNTIGFADHLILAYTPTVSTAKILIQVAGEIYGQDQGFNGAEARVARLNNVATAIQLGMKIDVDQKSTDWSNGELGRRIDQTIIDDLSQTGTNAPQPGGTQYYRIQVRPTGYSSSSSCRVRNASLLISEII